MLRFSELSREVAKTALEQRVMLSAEDAEFRFSLATTDISRPLIFSVRLDLV
jgi:hypothetical protein